MGAGLRQPEGGGQETSSLCSSGSCNIWGSVSSGAISKDKSNIPAPVWTARTGLGWKALSDLLLWTSGLSILTTSIILIRVEEEERALRESLTQVIKGLLNPHAPLVKANRAPGPSSACNEDLSQLLGLPSTLQGRLLVCDPGIVRQRRKQVAVASAASPVIT